MAAAPLFADSVVLANRFRIVRFIGAGGMGEVYEAVDEELGCAVAIKTLSAALQSDGDAVSRLKREVRLARKITHPNVCRTFDVVHHTVNTTASRDVLIVTMELLSGTTLAQRLRDEGPVDASLALHIADHVLSGLAAAHDAGVLHRDLKSSNIMLVPGSSPALRAVITDFGLAARWGDSTTTLTEMSDGPFAGTPAYMAPEIVEGQDATPQSDIYSLGVVLFEMVTGRLPFEADSPIATAALRLTHDAPPLDSLVPGIAGHWQAIVSGCLSRERATRFKSASDVLDSLHSGRGRSGTARRRAAKVGVTVALLGAALTLPASRYCASPREDPPTAPTPFTAAVRSVAVLGFTQVSGSSETAWLSTALSHALATELATTASLQSISTESVERARAELSLMAADSYARDTLIRLRQLLDVDLVVLGSFVTLPGSPRPIRFDVRVQDTTTGSTIAWLSETGTEAQLFDLLSRCGERLRSALGLEARTKQQGASLRAALPETVEGGRLYAESLARLQRLDPAGAKAKLGELLALEPDYPFAHAALARAHGLLGEDRESVEAAEEARRKSTGLERGDRLRLESELNVATRQWKQAAESYRALVAIHPEEYEYRLTLAEAQVRARDLDGARLTLDSLKNERHEDPRVTLLEASAAEASGDFKSGLESARAAAARTEAMGASLLTARARLSEGWALRNLGDSSGSMRANEAARALFATAGDFTGVARALVQIGGIHLDQADLSRAKRSYEDALSLARRTGNKRYTATAMLGLGNVFFEQGRLSEAGRVYSEVATAFESIGDLSSQATSLNNLASVYYELGEIARAAAADQQALEIRRMIGDRKGLALSLLNLGEVHLNAARLGEAQKHFDEARQLNQDMADRAELAHTLVGLARVSWVRNDIDLARTTLRESISIRQTLGLPVAVAEAKSVLAELELSSGQPRRALELAREAFSELQATAADSPELTAARATLVSALVAANELAEAANLVPRGDVSSIASLSSRLHVSISLARLDASRGRISQSIEALVSVETTARKGGLRVMAWESALQKAAVMAQGGRKTDARRTRERVRKEATALGATHYVVRATEQTAACRCDRIPVDWHTA
jgi:serine/threonine protein kinase/tetratricopeptide (TPR) repeat protein